MQTKDKVQHVIQSVDNAVNDTNITESNMSSVFVCIISILFCVFVLGSTKVSQLTLG